MVSKSIKEMLYGKEMHTYKVGVCDTCKWELPDNIILEDNVLYMVDYTCKAYNDPFNMSTINTVKKLEKVPQNIINDIQGIEEANKRINEYISNFV